MRISEPGWPAVGADADCPFTPGCPHGALKRVRNRQVKLSRMFYLRPAFWSRNLVLVDHFYHSYRSPLPPEHPLWVESRCLGIGKSAASPAGRHERAQCHEYMKTIGKGTGNHSLARLRTHQTHFGLWWNFKREIISHAVKLPSHMPLGMQYSAHNLLWRVPHLGEPCHGI
jgi:hypothetical protein